MSSETPAASPPGGDSDFARLPGAIFSPGRTFESIARRPSWILPVLLWIVCSVSLSVVLLPRMDFEKMTRERFEKAGRTVTDEQLQSIVERQRRFAPIFGYAGAVLAPVLIALLVAVVLWGAFRAFGWDSTYPQALGVTTHAFLPGVLGSLLLIPLVARQERMDPSAMGDLLRSNLGFLVARDSKVLHSLLSSIDVFGLWTLALLVLGFAEAARIPKGRSAALILSLWGIFVLARAGLAALF